jgi:hypothetical protein
MNDAAYAQLKGAFAQRVRPVQILREGLVGVDAMDAEDLRDCLRAGESASHHFHSAIPYFSFLTDEAALFYLPELLAIFADDRVELITVFMSLELDSGRRILTKLTDGERQAIHAWVQVLKAEEDNALCLKLLDRLDELVDHPNQTASADDATPA